MSGWEYSGDSCYLVDTASAVTWDQARASCQAIGSDLASIDGAEEQSFLLSLLS